MGSGLFVKDFKFVSLLVNMAYGIRFGLKQLVDFFEVRFHIEVGMMGRVNAEVTPKKAEPGRGILSNAYSRKSGQVLG